jgi:hypothetical protein
MAQVTDIRNTLADRLWVLFEAQATITTPVLAGNRDKGDEVGWLRNAIAKAPADRKRMEISFERGSNSLYTGRTGFAKEDPDFTTATGCDFYLTRQHTALITYREPLPNDPGAHPVQEAIEQTLLLAGPDLGLSIIPPDGLGVLTWEERKTRKDEFPFPGRVTVYRLPITTTQSALAQVALTA